MSFTKPAMTCILPVHCGATHDCSHAVMATTLLNTATVDASPLSPTLNKTDTSL